MKLKFLCLVFVVSVFSVTNTLLFLDMCLQGLLLEALKQAKNLKTICFLLSMIVLQTTGLLIIVANRYHQTLLKVDKPE